MDARRQFFSWLLQQYFSRNAKSLMQGSHHRQTQGQFVIKYFRHFAGATNIFCQILARQSFLVHSELYGFDRIGKANGIVLILVIGYKHTQQFQFVFLFLSRIGNLHQFFNSPKSILILFFSFNDMDIFH